ncbi:MAG TPA: TlpA disulfide reductase family protein [Labilithrix sp.]|jgi:peroxiredoxin
MRNPLPCILLAPLLLSACTRVDERAPPTAARADAADPTLASDLVGTRPPEWTAEAWTGSPPLTLASLRGKVVLVRWFMATSCPMCSASAPVLVKLDREYRSRGLVVVGMYHHKDDAPLTDEMYAQYIKDFGFTFPVARDPDWRTLHAWWLDGHERDFTSVSFLLDKQGRIRGIHPGGRLVYEPMRRAVERLIAEPATPST